MSESKPVKNFDMNERQPFRLAVVGGGTAGWICALMIRKFADDQKLPVEVTVVESSKIPTIGVGEGTTAVFDTLLAFLGIDKIRFLRETEATCKFGIRHVDWCRKGHFYYDGPIDDPHQFAVRGKRIPSPWLNIACVARRLSVTEPHLFTYLLAKFKAPYRLRPGEPPMALSNYLHAYHFDQALVGRFLRSVARNVTVVDALIASTEQNPSSGNIERLLFDDGEGMDVDFVVDCTGFRRRLIVGEMKARWIKARKYLPVNRAMPFWLDHPEGQRIPPFTLARALGSGWMWQIPTSTRMGCGYVYSDDFLTPAEARREVEETLGRTIEPRNDIPINSGRVDRAWIGNCLAAGLSQSFFEPLEATSIHGTIVQMFMFCSAFLERAVRREASNSTAYNQLVARQVDDFARFINIHYAGERQDTPFWRHVASECIDPMNRSRLRRWQRQMPTAQDFATDRENIAPVDEHLYYPVLDGLEKLPQATARRQLTTMGRLRPSLGKHVNELSRRFRLLSTRASDHREFLEWVANSSEA